MKDTLCCITCKTSLTGRQKKFCSRKCQAKDSNVRNQNYQVQQKRGSERRLELIKLGGNMCSICQYSKCTAALHFHHIDGTTKSFQLDLRNCSNRKWDNLLEEFNKCVLLCANCHSEIHNT